MDTTNGGHHGSTVLSNHSPKKALNLPKWQLQYPKFHPSNTNNFSQFALKKTFNFTNPKSMPFDSSRDKKSHSGPAPGTVASTFVKANNAMDRLRLNPNKDHKPDSYEDQQLEFSHFMFSALEKYLPPNLLNVSRSAKIQFMKEILGRYSPESERTRTQKLKDYREKIIKYYPRLNQEIYTMNASAFFVPSFLEAIRLGSEDSFRSVMAEPSPGIYVFKMLQLDFCQLLINEVNRFDQWVKSQKMKIMRPNMMNKHGAVLDDFGLEGVLDKWMDVYIRPLSRLLFPEIAGSTIDTHHGFVVEYGDHWDLDLGFHVDDSEVTLNVCLGSEFVGGELYFRGVRCDKHVNTETQPGEIFEYSHVPGSAVLHRGRHRHGARPTTSGYRINLLLWCRSSVFRELKKFQNDFSSWCGECQREKKERQRQSVAATKLELLKPTEEPTSCAASA